MQSDSYVFNFARPSGKPKRECAGSCASLDVFMNWSLFAAGRVGGEYLLIKTNERWTIDYLNYRGIKSRSQNMFLFSQLWVIKDIRKQRGRVWELVVMQRLSPEARSQIYI